jgi:hypothetical protein
LQWEWEVYKPGPEVYEQLWRIRQAPAVVTRVLPSDCPIPAARTRILDRRQTEGPIVRPFYVVEVIHSGSGFEQIVEADLSVILDFVSPAELERYENEQFELEAEAEAVARRADAEELAKRRLERNARVPGAGAGRGSRMLNGLGVGDGAPTRGRGRGRPRGSRGIGGGRTVNLGARQQDIHALVEAREDLRRSEEELQRVIPESEDEEGDEADARAQTSPNMMRSAFVANSALPVSPVQRRLSASLAHRGHPEVPDIQDDSDDDIDTGGYDARSMSSAAMQLRHEDDLGGQVIQDSEEEEFVDAEDEPPSKRRRTESVSMVPDSQPSLPQRPSIPEDAFRQTPLFPDRSSALDSTSQVADDAIPEDAFRQTPLFQDRSSMLETPSESSDESVPAWNRDIRDSQSPENLDPHPIATYNGHHIHVQARSADDADDDDAEVYVIEAIIDHFKERGTRYYLVKWEGYEDSHDWLKESDLRPGAADLLEEYNERIRQGNDMSNVNFSFDRSYRGQQ